ncbi:MAG: FAD-dependent oxidoreductase [Geminicoccaceae bacterium]
MDRRGILRTAAAISALPAVRRAGAAQRLSRTRPGDAGWPQPADWDRLRRAVGGRLITVRPPLEPCMADPASEECARILGQLTNPFYLGDEVGLTQTLGWVEAWTSRPSVYAVAAESTGDVVAAVSFAREHDLRLVVKGGGHSYQGTSNAPDSLLVWTRPMRAVTLHDAFVGSGCEGRQPPLPAVSIEAGALWGRVYDAVAVEAGRYVQGGGCLTVGVAGLVLSGGFGSMSKAFGMAAAGLIEAEIVTADGSALTVNACTHPDLFWALKGGGGGSFGVVTRLTLRTHALPDRIGAAVMSITARSDDAFRRLVGRALEFYREALLNPHWGEQMAFRPDNRLVAAMVFQGLDRDAAQAVWRPFLDWVAGSPSDFTIDSGPTFLALPGREFWDPGALAGIPGLVVADARPGAPPGNVFYAGDEGQVGQVIYAYQSAWLPAPLLGDLEQLGDALFLASRHWGVALHFNKGLAGASPEAMSGARDTATNPVVLDAFALLIAGAEGPPAYPGITGHEPDVAEAYRQAGALTRAMSEIRKLPLPAGAYLAESDFFEPDWAKAFWGPHYPRLLAIKRRYDPDDLFIVHHGVGSERWSLDGFTLVE